MNHQTSRARRRALVEYVKTELKLFNRGRIYSVTSSKKLAEYFHYSPITVRHYLRADLSSWDWFKYLQSLDAFDCKRGKEIAHHVRREILLHMRHVVSDLSNPKQIGEKYCCRVSDVAYIINKRLRMGSKRYYVDIMRMQDAGTALDIDTRKELCAFIVQEVGQVGNLETESVTPWRHVASAASISVEFLHRMLSAWLPKGIWTKYLHYQGGGSVWNLPTTGSKWTKPIILEIIRQLKREGVPLNTQHIRHYSPTLFGAATYHIGSWGDAVYAAGIDYLKECQHWTANAWQIGLSEEEKNMLLGDIQTEYE